MISDVHGEDQKLRHVINNASGALRPLVERLLGDKLRGRELTDFLALCFYPAEVVEQVGRTLDKPADLREYAKRVLRLQFVLVRELTARYSHKRGMRDFPDAWRPLLEEMLHEPTTDARRERFFATIVDELVRRGQALHVVHLVGRLIRNLAIDELIIAGDCWDRGPRGDRVVDYLRQQPSVSFVWGNHDASWIGAALGNEALICTVLRISLRYRRLGQLDEGYSIPLTPLEHLARTCYGDDPAAHFMPKSAGMRDATLVARMQKAAAVMQFKLEGQAIARNPDWGLDRRRLLHRIDHAAGTIEIDGRTYPLRDRRLPTVDPADPYELNAEERLCMDRLRSSFLASQKLGEHVRYVVADGAMSLVRDEHLIFHGCVPCDAAGNFLPMPLGGGRAAAGRELFEEIQRVVLRVPQTRSPADLDLMWYLWSGPRSPLFGKDRIATFERDLIADKHPHHEERDPYFKLIHEAWFCEKVLAAFGVDPERGLDRERPRAGQGRGRREPREAERQGDHDRRGVLRGLRRPRVHAGAGGRPHAAGPALAFRVGRVGHPRRRRHRADRADDPRLGPPPHRRRRRPGPRAQGQGRSAGAARRGVPHGGRPGPRRLRGVPVRIVRHEGTKAGSEDEAGMRSSARRPLSAVRAFAASWLHLF